MAKLTIFRAPQQRATAHHQPPTANSTLVNNAKGGAECYKPPLSPPLDPAPSNSLPISVFSRCVLVTVLYVLRRRRKRVWRGVEFLRSPRGGKIINMEGVLGGVGWRATNISDNSHESQLWYFKIETVYAHTTQNFDFITREP